MDGTGSTLFSGRLFRRQLRFGGNWLHIIFQQIVLEVSQIWRELASHYFLVDCFWKFRGNWLHIIFWWIVLEAAQIWRELAPHYFLTDCFGGNWLHIIFPQIDLEAAQIWWELAPHYFPANCFGNLEGTGSTFLSGGLFQRQLRFGGNWLHIIF